MLAGQYPNIIMFEVINILNFIGFTLNMFIYPPNLFASVLLVCVALRSPSRAWLVGGRRRGD